MGVLGGWNVLSQHPPSQPQTINHILNPWVGSQTVNGPPPTPPSCKYSPAGLHFECGAVRGLTLGGTHRSLPSTPLMKIHEPVSPSHLRTSVFWRKISGGTKLSNWFLKLPSLCSEKGHGPQLAHRKTSLQACQSMSFL